MSTSGQKMQNFYSQKNLSIFAVHLYSSTFFDITQTEHFCGLHRINELQAATFQCIQYLISTTLGQAAGVYCLPIIKFSFLAADSCKSSETELDGEVEEEVPSFPCSLITVAKDPKKKGTPL